MDDNANVFGSFWKWILGGSGVGFMGLVSKFISKQREIGVRVDMLESSVDEERKIARETRDTVIRLDTQMLDMKDGQTDILRIVKDMARKLP